MLFIKVTQGMYTLPQAGLLTNELLEKHLDQHGYFQELVPGLWKHKTQPILFTLTVDNYDVKYIDKEHADHLKHLLEENYKVTAEWTGTHHAGIHLFWNFSNRQVHLYLPGYVK